MKALKVKDVMTHEPFMVKPEDTVVKAAKLMKEIDCGILPVGSSDSPVGIITDRDITLRVTAADRDPHKIEVKEVMTKKLYTCDEEETLEHAAEQMRKHAVRRLVVTRGKKVTGIVNFTSLIRNKGDEDMASKVLHVLNKPVAAKKHAPGKMATAGAGCESCD